MNGNLFALGEDLRALEAVPLMAHEYELPAGDLKPCLAVVLDGNIGGAAKHEVAFIIAIECRRMGLTPSEAERVLTRWAQKVGYQPRKASRAINGAYGKLPDGRWRYFPPGLDKKRGSQADRVLGATCSCVGCPSNCPPLIQALRGDSSQTYDWFAKLGWPDRLKRVRHAALADWYRAICEIENSRSFNCGSRLHVSYEELAARAGRSKSHARASLDRLHRLGLLAEFAPGGGDGPKARNRYASTLRRAVPIPRPPDDLLGAISTGSLPEPEMGPRGERAEPIYRFPLVATPRDQVAQ